MRQPRESLCHIAGMTRVLRAEFVQIFGPGEAKGELKKSLEQEGLKAHILAIETVDKMTEGQISAKVREHFLA